MNIIDFALASADARLAAAQAAAQVPSAEAVKLATLAAIMRVEVDPLGWCCRDDVAEAIQLAWERLGAD